MRAVTHTRCASANGDESRLASRHVTRFGSATFAPAVLAQPSRANDAFSKRARRGWHRLLQRQRARTAVCVNTSAQSEYRGATAGVLTHAHARALWS